MKTRMLLLCLTLLIATAFIARASKPEVTPIREPLSGLPMQIGKWVGQIAPDMDSRVMDILGVDDYVNRVYYGSDSYPIGLYVGYYQSQKQGDTIHSPLNCLPGAGWNPVKRGSISIPLSGKPTIEINRIVILKGTDRQVVLYWYQSHGRVVASEYWGKIYTVLDAIRMNRTDAALVRVITPVIGGDEGAEIMAETNAIKFVQLMFPLLDRYLPN